MSKIGDSARLLQALRASGFRVSMLRPLDRLPPDMGSQVMACVDEAPPTVQPHQERAGFVVVVMRDVPRFAAPPVLDVHRAMVTALTRTERLIFDVLAERFGTWVDARTIIRDVVGTHHQDTALVRVHMHHMRPKLMDVGLAIESRRGLGYRVVSLVDGVATRSVSPGRPARRRSRATSA